MYLRSYAFQGLKGASCSKRLIEAHIKLNKG